MWVGDPSIQSLIDEDVNQDTVIKRALKKRSAYFKFFFNDHYFEINNKSEETNVEW
jgi:hypothetical protein